MNELKTSPSGDMKAACGERVLVDPMSKLSCCIVLIILESINRDSCNVGLLITQSRNLYGWTSLLSNPPMKSPSSVQASIAIDQIGQINIRWIAKMSTIKAIHM